MLRGVSLQPTDGFFAVARRRRSPLAIRGTVAEFSSADPARATAFPTSPVAAQPVGIVRFCALARLDNGPHGLSAVPPLPVTRALEQSDDALPLPSTPRSPSRPPQSEPPEFTFCSS